MSKLTRASKSQFMVDMIRTVGTQKIIDLVMNF